MTDTPFPVFLATMVGYALALGLIAFGVIGLFATQVSDSFGVGLLIGGIVVGGASYLASRGTNLGRLVLGGLAAATVVVAVVYAFSGPTYAIVPSLITAAFAAGTLWLLFVPESAKAFFAGR
ncbi:MAG TPA: hypothetical protein VH950_04945 [Gaiellaceae bacterium]